ncbi:hypothetical protein DEIPH_ctg052orf0103 [Deinococcus phoenicis]|uniref:Uncharacterized protein n=1 Tax=Deinococcus phoenicis TaxID=1476583 RepID=A0A016QML0_9DEIO|nr:hypothetical protein [Deinococcus phoenicis]EYB67092.1 hypothetical protein DEIPH_ctg052orf0103 [Deinococcus phoenicis]
MRPDLPRPLISIVGLVLGFTVYALAGRAPEPWPGVLIGGMFALLGIAAWFYGRGERWIQVLGVLLLVYGVVRMAFLH